MSVLCSSSLAAYIPNVIFSRIFVISTTCIFINETKVYYVNSNVINNMLQVRVGDIGGWGGIKMVSASTPSANDPAKDLILVHTTQLKPKHKSQEEWYLVV